MKQLTVHCITPFKAWALNIAILPSDQMPLPFTVTEAGTALVTVPGLSLEPWTFYCKVGRRAGTERRAAHPRSSGNSVRFLECLPVVSPAWESKSGLNC